MFRYLPVLCYLIYPILCNETVFNRCNNLIEKSITPTVLCDYNPDVDLNTPQIIRRHGYPAETHTIVTEDGYLLSLHRIPGSKSGEPGGQPVFLQHGLLSSSTDWVSADNQSLAFILADSGYDVWLGNSRGNTYSKGHIYYPIESAQYWNFTWHEMGIYDLPAALYYVSNKTNQYGKILYVGHSMGTTMFFVLASERPQVAKNVKFMAALAPVAYMTHIRSPIHYLSPFVHDIEWLFKHLGIHEFLPSNKLLKYLAYDCELLRIDKVICKNIIFVICGFDKEEFNQTLLPVVMNHDPAGTSAKTVIHYAQEINNDGKFQQFDYGPTGNKIKYGTLKPPIYKLKNIKVPTYLMYARNDWFANSIDVMRLARNLTYNTGSYQVPLDHFNHVDFLFGKDAAKLLYEPLLKILRNYTEAN